MPEPDYVSTDLAGAAMLSRDDMPPDVDWPSPAEYRDDVPERHPDPYTGRCGGCGRPVSPRDEGGSCLWRGGAWHPACRETDRTLASEQRQQGA